MPHDGTEGDLAPAQGRLIPMNEIKPPRNLNPALCAFLQKKMLEACQKIAGEHGLAVGDRGQTNVDLHFGFDATFRVAIPGPDGTIPEPGRLLFEALADGVGLAPEDFGKEFSTGRETFRIVGLDPRRPKYPVSAERVSDGRSFKFTAENVAMLLRAGMRDVSPSDCPPLS